MLEIRNVSFTRPGGLSFSYDLSVDGGEILAVQGPSGVGKTTLLDLIAGFELPDSGSISWNGSDFLAASPWDRPVTTVFQSDNLFEHLSCFENVRIAPPAGRRDDHGAINEAFYRLGIDGLQQRPPEAISGGQQQRGVGKGLAARQAGAASRRELQRAGLADQAGMFRFAHGNHRGAADGCAVCQP